MEEKAAFAKLRDTIDDFCHEVLDIHFDDFLAIYYNNHEPQTNYICSEYMQYCDRKEEEKKTKEPAAAADTKEL